MEKGNQVTLYERNREEIQQGVSLLERIHPHINEKWFAKSNGRVDTGEYRVAPGYFSRGGVVGRASNRNVEVFEIFPETEKLEESSSRKYGTKEKKFSQKEKIGGIPVFDVVKNFEMVGEGIKKIRTTKENSYLFKPAYDICSGGRACLYGRTKSKLEWEVFYLKNPKDALIGGGMCLLSMEFSLIDSGGIRVRYDHDTVSLEGLGGFYGQISQGIESYVLRKKDERDQQKTEQERKRFRCSVLNEINSSDIESLKNVVEYLEQIRPNEKIKELRDLIIQGTESLSIEELTELRKIIKDK
jgi:hypothetical protein